MLVSLRNKGLKKEKGKHGVSCHQNCGNMLKSVVHNAS